MELCSESDAGNVLSALTSSLQRLTAFQNQPQALSEAVNLLASAQIRVEEAIGELNRFVDHFDADPERQQMLEERRTPSTPRAQAPRTAERTAQPAPAAAGRTGRPQCR